MKKNQGNDAVTVRMRIIESYANLGMAHKACTDGAAKYGRIHYSIRAKMRKGLFDGTMSMRPLADDEKLKLSLPQSCSYCGSSENLSVDHLVPTARGGPNIGENLVWACRSCNSSKGSRDMLSWWFNKHLKFPPILLLRRYLKIAWKLAEDRELLDEQIENVTALPINLDDIPTKYPNPTELSLWVDAVK